MRKDVYDLNERMIEKFNWYEDKSIESYDYDPTYEDAFEGDYKDFYGMDLEYEMTSCNIYSDNWLDDIDYSGIEMNSIKPYDYEKDFPYDALDVAKIFRHFNWREPYSNEEIVNYVENGQYAIDLQNYYEYTRSSNEDNISKRVMLRSVFDEKVSEVWGNDIYRAGEFTGATEHMVFGCCICNGLFVKEGRQVYNGSGCPRCHKKFKKGEEVVKSFLDTLNIEYETQDDDGCRNNITNRPLPFDFVIPNNGDILYVEVQGRQHYEPVEYFGGEEKYVDTQKRDRIKKDFANENGTYVELDYREHDVELLKQRINTILLPLLERGDR